jgi:hydrogenase expression/formation protein HypC
MCLAIPGIVESIFEQDGLRMCKVDFAGLKRIVCLEYCPSAQVGEYVLVHVGFALSVIDEKEALLTLSSLTDEEKTSELGEKGSENAVR